MNARMCRSLSLGRLWLCIVSIAIAMHAPLAAAEPLAAADSLPIRKEVEFQPFAAQARRVAAALEQVGAPLDKDRRAALDAALALSGEAGVVAIQNCLDPLCLAGVSINAESRVKAAPGPAARELLQHGWRVFLIKVENDAGITPELRATSPHAAPLHVRSTSKAEPAPAISAGEVTQRWMDVAMFKGQPLAAALSGLPVEYRLIEIYSRDAGRREAQLAFDIGQGTQDLGFRSEVNILFTAVPAVEVKLEIADDHGGPSMAWFVIKDDRGRVYPAKSRRLAPDFFFHDQIYRAHGETVRLPPGRFTVTYGRGPEYVVQSRTIEVPDERESSEFFRLKRWIKMADRGWFSGDHHVHAAGCSHYESPTQGVTPEDMMRHVLGEDLNVGCVLSWGPCWYHQKQYFEGKNHPLTQPRHVLRYDVEVSGFPSSHAGHLCLLRLKEDDYPGTTRIEEWPSWDLPVLQWGQKQGAIVGFSHSGWGLKVDSTKLPTYEMPKFDGIGANEYIVDVTHGACDFISAVDTPAVWELNIWYHTLNCGYTCRISGETDFPCIYGERVGLGRIYAKLPSEEPIDFDGFVAALKDGRSYCCDGLSHLFDYRVNNLGVGEPGDQGRASVLKLARGASLKVAVQAAARLEETPDVALQKRPLDQKPYWHLERARIGDTREVPVELVVNGEVVATERIQADGSVIPLTFDYQPQQSCWVALRIFPSCHTNPVFVEVDGQPIRASAKSAAWCLEAVDVCWRSKEKNIRESEKAAAAAAYEAARVAYRRIAAECAASAR